MSIQHFRAPDDRRQEKQQLDQARDNLRNIAEAGAEQTQKKAPPDSVEGNDENPQQRRQQSPIPWRQEIRRNDDDDSHIVRQDKNVTPYDTHGVHRQWKLGLF